MHSYAKRIITYCCVFVLLSLLCTGCFQSNDNINERDQSNGNGSMIERDQNDENTPESEQLRQDDMRVRATIYPTGSSANTYYFEIDENGLLSSYMGSRQNDDIETEVFLRRILIKEQKQLSEEEMEYLFALIDKLQQSDFYSSESWLDIDGGLYVALLYNNEKYEISYEEGESDVLELIIDKIISLSPILVDIHGWS